VIDVIHEDLLSLNEACREKVFRNSATGKPIHFSQLYRYVLNGTRAASGARVKLEAVKTPGGLRTSREAIQRFIESLTNADPHAGSAPPPARSSLRRDKAIERAERELEAAGL
jgi:hypothetical protein